MKRNLKIVMLVFLISICSGCVKMNLSMDIKKDKSMDLVIIEAIDKSFLESMEGNSETGSLMSKEDISNLESQGFLVREYDEDGKKGYTISKNFKNIDQLSTEQVDIVYDLNLEDLGKENSNTYIFSIKEGFFKNIYTAKIKSSDMNDVESGMESSGSMNEENAESEGDVDINGSIDIDDSTMEGLNNGLNTMMSSMDLKFKINLPYKAISSNATTIENKGKTLTWDYTKLEDDTINFQFALYNMTNVYIVAGIVLIIVSLIVVKVYKSITKKPTSGYSQNNTSYFNSNQSFTQTSNSNSTATYDNGYNNYGQSTQSSQNVSTITPFSYENNITNVQQSSFLNPNLVQQEPVSNEPQVNMFTNPINNNNDLSNINNQPVQQPSYLNSNPVQPEPVINEQQVNMFTNPINDSDDLPNMNNPQMQQLSYLNSNLVQPASTNNEQPVNISTNQPDSNNNY